MDSLWKLGDEFRGQTKNSEDYQWSVMTSKLAELTRSKVGRQNNLDYPKNVIEAKAYNKVEYHEDNKLDSINLGLMNLDLKINDAPVKSLFHGAYSMSNAYQKNNANEINSFKLDYINNNCNNNAIVDKRFKTLPSTEMLPRNEILGGYIFVCNNDTMQDDLKRQLFGLPPRYRDSVRAITPGLPLFLYNYTTHQLHGIFEAASFGGSNIDPTAWEDKKCKGVSRFPAQVRIRVRKLCKALEEDAFRPVLYHYDGPKFRLELSISETLQLLDLCEKEGHIRL
ncbi:B2 protein-like isoform X2 [Zingiber officinale]|uniref:B2 protein-like isoform X2 n=1 Tax=Zingiber officinale TaxID=94328 RepID=UPI001C4D0FD8|nr:B2 protein-like isoform X2 [Zingiber officinale]